MHMSRKVLLTAILASGSLCVAFFSVSSLHSCIARARPKSRVSHRRLFHFQRDSHLHRPLDMFSPWQNIPPFFSPISPGPHYHSSPRSSNYYASTRLTTKEAPNYSGKCYRQANQHHHQFYRYREDRAGTMGRIPCWIHVSRGRGRSKESTGLQS